MSKGKGTSASLPAVLLLALSGCGSEAPAPLASEPARTPLGRVFAYVADRSGLSAFAFDTHTGGFTSVGRVAQVSTVSVRRPATDPSGRILYYLSGSGAQHTGYPETFYLSAYRIDEDGALRPIETLPVGEGKGVVPFAAVHPSGRFLYLAGSGVNLAGYAIDGAKGTLTPLGELLPSTEEVEAVVADPRGRFLYAVLADRVTSRLLVSLRVDEARGLLTATEALALEGVDGMGGLLMSPSGEFLFVGGGLVWPSTVLAYRLDIATGAPTAVNSAPTGQEPSDLALSGRFLYVTNRYSQEVWAYTVDARTGALTAIGPVARVGVPKSVTVDPSGRFLFVNSAGNLLRFRIDAASGQVTPEGAAVPGEAVAFAEISDQKEGGEE